MFSVYTPVLSHPAAGDIPNNHHAAGVCPLVTWIGLIYPALPHLAHQLHGIQLHSS